MKYVKILILYFCTCTQLLGQQPEVLSKIHHEAEMNSHVMKTISYLSDVHGPRLMGTPNYYAAVKWTENQLKDWGITKTYLQSFDNGQKGWAAKNFQVEMIEPTYSSIIAHPLAYTSSTKGVQIGEVLFLPNLDTIFNLSGQLEGKIILLGSYYEPVNNADYRFSRRLSNEELENARNNPDPNDVLIGYHSRRSTSQAFGIQNLMRKQKEKFFKFCEEQKVLALIEPSDFPYGILHADGNRAVPSYMRKNDILLLHHS